MANLSSSLPSQHSRFTAFVTRRWPSHSLSHPLSFYIYSSHLHLSTALISSLFPPLSVSLLFFLLHPPPLPPFIRLTRHTTQRLPASWSMSVTGPLTCSPPRVRLSTGMSQRSSRFSTFGPWSVTSLRTLGHPPAGSCTKWRSSTRWSSLLRPVQFCRLQMPCTYSKSVAHVSGPITSSFHF